MIERYLAVNPSGRTAEDARAAREALGAAGDEQVRVFRVIEYAGPRYWVEETLLRSASLPDREALDLGVGVLKAVRLSDEQAAIVAPWVES